MTATISRVAQARAIVKEYGVTLPEAWSGRREVLHAWHTPYIYCPMTWARFIDRVIEIGTTKPVSERAERLALMRPSIYGFNRTPAYAEWQKAYAALEKADAEWEKADAEWEKGAAQEIMVAHKAECPNCKWDGCRMPQFD